MTAKFISEVIGEEYENWTNPHFINENKNLTSINVNTQLNNTNKPDKKYIYINSQTGTGKTTFIINTLIDFLRSKNFNVLYVCNRVSLKEKVKIDLINHFIYNQNITNSHLFPNIQLKENINYPFSKSDNYTKYKLSVTYNIYLNNTNITIPEEQKNLYLSYKTINDVTILSYQELAIALKAVTDKKCNLPYFIILDEVHYLLEDSLFNPEIDYIRKIFSYFTNTNYIFMSATDYEIKKVLIPFFHEKTKVQMYDLHFNTTISAELKTIYETIKPIEYTLPSDYSYLKPYYFNEIQDIVEKIIRDKTDFKWVLFLNNIKVCKKIKKALLNNNVSCDFVYSNKNECSEKINRLVRTERFEQKVLITTSILENGINIRDEKVKNVVIFSNEKTPALQMLGRIRIDRNKEYSDFEKINLYIKNYTKSDFEKFLKDNQKKQEAIILYKHSPDIFYNKYIINNKYKWATKICYLDKHYLKVNEFLAFKLYFQQEYYKSVYEAYSHTDDAYIKTFLSWLNLEKTYNKKNWINENYKDNLILFLNLCCNSKSIKPEIFRNNFKNIIMHLNPLAKYIKDTPPGLKLIKDYLKENNLDYVIKSKQITHTHYKETVWIIEHKEI